MNNLDRIKNWLDNLEEVYKTSGCKSREEFMRKYMGYDKKSNTTKTFYLIRKMEQEVLTYSEEELEEYSNVIKILNNLDYMMRTSVGFTTTLINNLTVLYNNAKRFSGALEVQKTVPKDLIDSVGFYKLYSYDIEKAKQTSQFEITNTFGTIGSTYCVKDGAVHHLDLDDKDVYICSSKESLKILKNARKGTFRHRVLQLVMELIEKGELQLGTAFFNKTMTSRKTDFKVKLGSKSVKIDPNKVSKIDYISRLDNKKTEAFKVVDSLGLGKPTCYFV